MNYLLGVEQHGHLFSKTDPTLYCYVCRSRFVNNINISWNSWNRQRPTSRT